MKIKKSLTFLLTFLFVNVVNAQDKIVTTQGDTILCRIVSISEALINYEQRDGEAIVGRFIPIDRVLEYSRNASGVYQNLPKNTVEKTVETKSIPYKRWRAGLQFGGAHLLVSTTDSEIMRRMGYSYEQAADYAKQYKNGIQFSADMHVMCDEHAGLGLKYQFFHTSAKTNNILLQTYIYDDYYGYRIPAYVDFSLKEDLYINYIGFSIFLHQRFGNRQRFALSGQFSLGAAFLRNEIRTNLPVNELNTTTITAATLELSTDYYILPWLSVGATAGLFFGMVENALM